MKSLKYQKIPGPTVKNPGINWSTGRKIGTRFTNGTVVSKTRRVEALGVNESELYAILVGALSRDRDSKN